MSLWSAADGPELQLVEALADAGVPVVGTAITDPPTSRNGSSGTPGNGGVAGEGKTEELDPDFTLPSLDGTTVSRDDFAGAPALLVAFL